MPPLFSLRVCSVYRSFRQVWRRLESAHVTTTAIRTVSLKTERSHLVVTGSSAGGIEALSRVLSTLPAAFPAPIVVAQHLDPRVTSNLGAILAKRTTLRIAIVADSAKLEPATVYVVPADRHVEITDHEVRVHADGQGRPKPSIDVLFATAAKVFEDRLIAVVLTGLGSDGSNGARAVKEHGGTVIIEDPMTASFPSMPASLEPALVDVIAPLDSIGPELIRLVHESIAVVEDSPELSDLLARVQTESGIDFAHYKPATIKRRLARQIAANNKKDLAEYLSFLDEDPDELARLVSMFLIKVTEFFRDRELFEQLREVIVPELIEQARERGSHELRFWSAGCATGEEAYSLGILVAENLRDEQELFNIRIFATDIDEAAISFARRGIYPRDSLSNLEPDLVDRYFTVVPEGYEVSKTIRAMTVFGLHDLGQRAPFPRIDLALCRNVLIYFSKDLQLRTLHVFAFSLRTGGYLILGKAETTNPLAESFTIVNSTLRMFRRYGERVMIPPAQVKRPVFGGRDVEVVRRPFPAFEQHVRDGRLSITEKLGAFLNSSSIGVILVDRRYDIVAINASARTMYNVHGVAVGEDLVHLMSSETANHVRTLLDSALRNEQPTVGGEEVAVDDGAGNARYLTVSCYPERAGTTREVTGAVILTVDVSEIVTARRDMQIMLDMQSRDMQGLRQSETRARERQRSLVQANRELATANSELRAQNDSLVINAEESAAATEEVETLNEEMQATNEELETLNEEFQATIEELNTTNDEHEARNEDLTDQVAKRESARRQTEGTLTALTTIVDALPRAVAAVDPLGGIIVANRRFRDILNLAPESSVQIDDDAGATIPLAVVLRRAGEGQTFAFTYRAISPDQSRTLYTGHARPLSGSQSANGSADSASGIVELEPG